MQTRLRFLSEKKKTLNPGFLISHKTQLNQYNPISFYNTTHPPSILYLQPRNFFGPKIHFFDKKVGLVKGGIVLSAPMHRDRWGPCMCHGVG